MTLRIREALLQSRDQKMRGSPSISFFLFVEPPDSPPHLFLVLVSLEPLSAPSILILGTNANHLPPWYIESASISTIFKTEAEGREGGEGAGERVHPSSTSVPF